MPAQIIRLASQPGVKRDGTPFDSDNYSDGQWARFQRGLPRKIGGYRTISNFLSAIPRAMHGYTRNQLTYVHAASANALSRLVVDGNGNSSTVVDRTPTALVSNAANLWQFDVEALAGTNTIKLIAQAAPNLNCICNSEGGQLFYGDLFGTAALTEITLPSGGDASGGVVVLHPYTFFFGNNGYLGWSVPGDPGDLSGLGSGAANVTGQKIVRAIPVRGGPGNAPSGLFWSADALIRASFVGGDPIFQFDTITTESSILSSSGVIEYDGIFYWAGTDRFLMFNGVVREIPNEMNLNYFFDGLNAQYRQKVFAFKVPRFGEIWWCYPRGNATEPSHAVIYNVRENIWYDTELPNGGRASAISPSVFSRPMAAGVVPTSASKYRLWMHESGVDQIDGQSIQPIQSYFETSNLSLPASQSPSNRAIEAVYLEPDFIQSGDLTVQALGSANARANDVAGEAKVITEQPTTPAEQIVYFKEQRRQLRFRFESNTVGGNYQMGKCLLHIQEGDGTIIS